MSKNKLVTCATCGATIAKEAKTCPQCGAKNKQKMSVGKGIGLFILILFLCGVVGGCIGSLSDSDDDSSSSSTTSTSTTQKEEKKSSSKEKEPEETEEVQEIQIDTTINEDDYWKLSDDILYKYGQYMVGQKVITVITADSVSGGSIKANTGAGEDSVFFDIVCEMKDKENANLVVEGAKLTIAGTVEENSINSSTVNMVECSIIGLGEIEADLEADRETQIAVGQGFQQYTEQQEAEAAAAAISDYKAKCVDVSYSDVERNPDTYNGTYVVVSGKVEQVSEGLFSSVTLRLNENGNMWYVTYSREDGESRILEGDYITAYGECKGVESYTSVLGSQITIPAMKMEYYE